MGGTGSAHCVGVNLAQLDVVGGRHRIAMVEEGRGGGGRRCAGAKHWGAQHVPGVQSAPLPRPLLHICEAASDCQKCPRPILHTWHGAATKRAALPCIF